MLSIRRLASYRPKGQGEAGYEAAKSDVNRSDRHLFNRHCDGTGNEERPLRGTNPNRPDSLSSQPTNLKGKRPGGERSSPLLVCQVSSMHPFISK